MLDTREHADIRQLEALWNAPAIGQKEKRRELGRRSLLAPAGRISGRLILWGWVVFIVGVIAFQPAPNPEAATALWAVLVEISWLLALVASALVGAASPRWGFGVATAAGGLGIALSVACSATAHHLGSFWLVELGATGALTVMAAAGFAARLGRR